MTPRLRWITRIVAWGAFTFLAPVLMMIALGHRFTPTTPTGVSVGTFLIRTLPRGASVFLHDLKESSRTPTAISSLRPGTYELRIEKAGYRPWKKRLEIVGTRLTDVRNVRLYPTTIEENILRTGVRTFSLSPQQNWLMLVELTNTQQVFRIVPATSPTDEGIVPTFNAAAGEALTFSWAPDEKHVAVTAGRGVHSRAVVIEVATGGVTPLQSVGEILGWLPGDPDTLVFRRQSSLMAKQFPRAEETILARDIQATSATEGFLAFSKENIALELAPKGSIITIIKRSTGREILSVPLQDGQTIDRITVSPRGDVLLSLLPTGGMLLWNAAEERWQPLQGSGEHYFWSPDGTKLLWQTSAFDVWVMNIHEERTVLPPFIPELLIRLSTPITNVRWFPDSQQVLFREQDIVRVIEVDGRNGHLVESLLGTNRGDAITEIAKDSTLLLTTAKREERDVILRAFLRVPEDR